MQEIDDIENISQILNSCKNIDSNEFQVTGKTLNIKNNISIVFTNIDGNVLYFDSSVMDISQYKSQFSFITIAENNIDESIKGLYQNIWL